LPLHHYSLTGRLQGEAVAWKAVVAPAAYGLFSIQSHARLLA
jgi:hypothetical protein